MQHSPAEYFIKYLCSRPGTTVGEVKNYVAGMGLGIMPYEKYVEDLHKEIQKVLPPNYNPRDRTHKPSQMFLKTHRIRGLWKSGRTVKEAVDVFNNGPLREIVESLVLTGMDDEQISELLSYYKAVGIIPGSIAEFRHYFWNVELLTFEDWSYYLTQPSIQPIKLTALKSPKNLDGIRLTLYKMGIMPRALDRMEVFTTLRDVGFMNFLEANGFPQGQHKAEMLGSYAHVVRMSQDKLDEYSAGEQNVIDEFYKHTTIGNTEVKQKTISQLQGDADEQRSIRKLPPRGKSS